LQVFGGVFPELLCDLRLLGVQTAEALLGQQGFRQRV